MRIIPFKEEGQWREQVELTGTIFNLVFRWNAMNEFWSMDLLDGNDMPIILGVKVVTNYNLLEQYSYPNQPLGDIVCQNIVGGTENITRRAMSTVAQLLYYEPGELATYEVSS